MCDYSLHHVSSRPAKVADKLVTTELVKPGIRGFAAVGELGAKLVIHDTPPGVAVCLLPGTELAFDDDVEYDRAFSFLGKARVNHKVASFRQIELERSARSPRCVGIPKWASSEDHAAGRRPNRHGAAIAGRDITPSLLKLDSLPARPTRASS